MMDFISAEEALNLLDRVLPDAPLNNLQETVFCQVWEGKTYGEIAENCHYEYSYIRDIGFKLWQYLSDVLDRKVSKSNIRAVLGHYARSHPVNAEPKSKRVLSSALECPNGPVPLYSQFYIERPPIEAQVYREILKPGGLIRIRAPRYMGKTSLLRRILAHANTCQIQPLSLSLHRADREVFSSLDRFLRWFCANISRQLGIEPKIEQFWDINIGSKVSCTAYFEEYLLQNAEKPLAIALDEVDRLFEYPHISREFLPLLRTYEDGKEFANWQQVRWVIAHATDVYVPLKLSQSPFNIGLSIKLPEFTREQVRDLALRHGLTWAQGDEGMNKLLPLLEQISCHPEMVRLALYHLAGNDLSLERLIAEAPTQGGIYSDRLREFLAALHPHRDLQIAFKQVVESSQPVALDPIVAYRLESIGLVKLRGDRAIPSCELYRQYFTNFLAIA